jgi:hypothetical protein
MSDEFKITVYNGFLRGCRLFGYRVREPFCVA